jgi:hypothetical protein
MSRVFTGINIFMALLFIFAGVMQYNDPDVIRWAAMYGSAAFACILWSIGRYNKWICGIIMLVSLLWITALLFDAASGPFDFEGLMESLEMKNESIELYREIGGLLIVTLWMGALFFKKKSAK